MTPSPHGASDETSGDPAAPALTGPPRPVVGVVLRSALWLLLGGWVGSWLCFALLVAPAVFRVVPSELAGQLVGPVLAVLHGYGVAAGLALAALAAALGRGPWLWGLPLVLAAACLASELGVTPQLEVLRDSAFGPDGSVEAAAAYRRLHGLSMTIFSAVLLGAIALVVLHARKDTPQAGESS